MKIITLAIFLSVFLFYGILHAHTERIYPDRRCVNNWNRIANPYGEGPLREDSQVADYILTGIGSDLIPPVDDQYTLGFHIFYLYLLRFRSDTDHYGYRSMDGYLEQRQIWLNNIHARARGSGFGSLRLDLSYSCNKKPENYGQCVEEIFHILNLPNLEDYLSYVDQMISKKIYPSCDDGGGIP